MSDVSYPVASNATVSSEVLEVPPSPTESSSSALSTDSGSDSMDMAASTPPTDAVTLEAAATADSPPAPLYPSANLSNSNLKPDDNVYTDDSPPGSVQPVIIAGPEESDQQAEISVNATPLDEEVQSGPDSGAVTPESEIDPSVVDPSFDPSQPYVDPDTAEVQSPALSGDGVASTEYVNLSAVLLSGQLEKQGAGVAFRHLARKCELSPGFLTYFDESTFKGAIPLQLVTNVQGQGDRGFAVSIPERTFRFRTTADSGNTRDEWVTATQDAIENAKKNPQLQQKSAMGKYWKAQGAYNQAMGLTAATMIENAAPPSFDSIAAGDASADAPPVEMQPPAVPPSVPNTLVPLSDQSFSEL